MKKIFLLPVLFALLAGCAIKYEYKLMDELFKQAPSKSFKEKGYTVHVAGTPQKMEGFLLEIPAKSGIFYLQVAPTMLLQKGFFVYLKDKKHIRLPIFQRDWNKPLSTLNDRHAVGKQCHAFQKKFGPKKK